MAEEEKDCPSSQWKIQTPARLAINGPSSSGKSELLLKLVSDPTVWYKKPTHIIYCAPALHKRQSYIKRLYDAVAESGADLFALEDIPDGEEITHLVDSKYSKSSLDTLTTTDKSGLCVNKQLASINKHMSGQNDNETFNNKPVAILVIDDFLAYPKQVHKTVTNHMIMDSHHDNFSVILCLQNAFEKDLVRISRSLTGRFILYQLCDWRQINNLNSNIYPGKNYFIQSCLSHSKEALGVNYVFINLHPFGGLRRQKTCYTCIFHDQRAQLSDGTSSPYFFDLDNYTAEGF